MYRGLVVDCYAMKSHIRITMNCSPSNFTLLPLKINWPVLLIDVFHMSCIVPLVNKPCKPKLATHLRSVRSAGDINSDKGVWSTEIRPIVSAWLSLSVIRTSWTKVPEMRWEHCLPSEESANGPFSVANDLLYVDSSRLALFLQRHSFPYRQVT